MKNINKKITHCPNKNRSWISPKFERINLNDALTSMDNAGSDNAQMDNKS